MTCFDSQVIERLTMIRLDACGRIPLVGDDPTPALKGLADTIQTLSRTRNVNIPTATITKVVSGKTCIKPRPSPTDTGFAYTITFCGSNPLAEVIAGYKTLDMSGADVIGWEDVNISGSPKAALEIIFSPSADACTAGEAAQCQAVLVPMLEQWVRTGNEDHNGEAVPDLVLTAQTSLNKNLFGNFASGAAMAAAAPYLAHWAPKYADLSTGRSWAYTRLVDCPPADDTEDPCTLVALTAPVS